MCISLIQMKHASATISYAQKWESTKNSLIENVHVPPVLVV